MKLCFLLVCYCFGKMFCICKSVFVFCICCCVLLFVCYCVLSFVYMLVFDIYLLFKTNNYSKFQ